MTPNEYQALCLTTLVTENTRDTLTMCGLGIAGEAGEVCDIIKKGLFHKSKGGIDGGKLADELGDLMWYTAVAAHALNVSMEDISPVVEYPNEGDFASTGLHLALWAGDIASMIADMRISDKYHASSRIKTRLDNIMICIARIAPRIGISFGSIMQRNIEKLQARHASGQATANGGTFNPHYQSDTVK